MAVTPQRMSLAEFLKLPEVKPALELRQGMVSQKVPAFRTARIHPSSGLAVQVVHVRRAAGACSGIPRSTRRPRRGYLRPRCRRLPLGSHPRGREWRLAASLHHSARPGRRDHVARADGPRQLDRCRELVGHGVRMVVLVDPTVGRPRRSPGRRDRAAPRGRRDRHDRRPPGLRADRLRPVLAHPRPPPPDATSSSAGTGRARSTRPRCRVRGTPARRRRLATPHATTLSQSRRRPA